MSDAIYMLNVLWFKKDGGREKYAEYAAAATPLVRRAGGEIVSGYTPDMVLIGDWNPDLVFVVRYPSWAAFEEFMRSPEYLEIAPLREEALRESYLVRCRRVGLAEL